MSMSATLQIDFPPEIVQELLHCAARLSTSFSLSLCRVSSWTRRLALPHLYSTVILKTSVENNCFFQCLSRSPFSPVHPQFDPKKAVRNLWVEAPTECVVSFFEVCDNLTRVALHAHNLLWLVYTSSTVPGGLKRLSHDAITRKQDLDVLIMKGGDFELSRFVNFNPVLTTPLFSKITRLRVVRIENYETQLKISHYSRLTHLAIPCYYNSHNPSAFSRVLEHPFLEVFVIVLYHNLSGDETRAKVRWWVEEMRKTERSLKMYVVESSSTLSEVRKDWERETRGGQSFWDRASLHSIF